MKINYIHAELKNTIVSKMLSTDPLSPHACFIDPRQKEMLLGIPFLDFDKSHLSLSLLVKIVE